MYFLRNHNGSDGRNSSFIFLKSNGAFRLEFDRYTYSILFSGGLRGQRSESAGLLSLVEREQVERESCVAE